MPELSDIAFRNPHTGEWQDLTGPQSVAFGMDDPNRARTSYLGREFTRMSEARKELESVEDPQARHTIISSIINGFESGNPALCKGTLHHLAKIYPECQTALIEALTGADSQIAARAALALGYLARKAEPSLRTSALAALQELLGHDNFELRNAGRTALRFIGGNRAKLYLRDALAHAPQDDAERTIQELCSFADPALIEPVLSHVRRSCGASLVDGVDIPSALAMLLSPAWIAARLSSPQVRVLAKRFGYVDTHTLDKLANDASGEFTSCVRETVRAVGIATDALLTQYQETDCSSRHELIESWVARVNELQWALIPEEISGKSAAISISPGVDRQSRVGQDLLFAALRASDLANLEIKLAAKPFDYKQQRQLPGRFFYMSAAWFREGYFLPALAECQKLLGHGEDSTDAGVHLLPYAVFDHAALNSLSSEESGFEAKCVFESKWIAAVTILSADAGIALLKTSDAACELRSPANKHLWKYAVLDAKLIQLTEALIGHAELNPLWQALSPGSRACLKLYAYDRLLSSECCGETLDTNWGRALHELALAEHKSRSRLPSIGIEIQAMNLPSEKLFAWKEALKYFGVPSPRRPEFFSVAEAAFLPVWAPAAFQCAASALANLGFHGKQGPASSLHLSLAGDFGDEAKYLAIVLWALTGENPHPARQGPIWRRGMTKVMSKGLIFKNYNSVAVSPNDDIPPMHCEIRTGRIGVRKDSAALRWPNVPYLLADFQHLAAAALSFQKLKAGNKISAYETPLAEEWADFRAKMDALYSDAKFGTAELLKANWYEATGDPRDEEIIEKLPIIGILERTNSFHAANVEAWRELCFKTYEIFSAAAQRVRSAA